MPCMSSEYAPSLRKAVTETVSFSFWHRRRRRTIGLRVARSQGSCTIYLKLKIYIMEIRRPFKGPYYI